MWKEHSVASGETGQQPGVSPWLDARDYPLASIQNIAHGFLLIALGAFSFYLFSSRTCACANPRYTLLSAFRFVATTRKAIICDLPSKAHIFSWTVFGGATNESGKLSDILAVCSDWTGPLSHFLKKRLTFTWRVQTLCKIDWPSAVCICTNELSTVAFLLHRA